MGEAARKRINVDEFLVWDDGTDRRYELVGGEIVAMAPPSNAHGAIVANAVGELRTRLRPPCRVLTEVGVRFVWRDDSYYQADLAVTCSPILPRESAIANSVVLIEVLSPSTMAHDRGVKLVDYRHIASVQEIVFTSSDEKRVELWRRGSEAWTVRDLEASDHLQLESIGFDMAVEGLYDGLDFTVSEAVSG